MTWSMMVLCSSRVRKIVWCNGSVTQRWRPCSWYFIQMPEHRHGHTHSKSETETHRYYKTSCHKSTTFYRHHLLVHLLCKSGTGIDSVWLVADSGANQNNVLFQAWNWHARNWNCPCCFQPCLLQLPATFYTDSARKWSQFMVPASGMCDMSLTPGTLPSIVTAAAELGHRVTVH